MEQICLLRICHVWFRPWGDHEEMILGDDCLVCQMKPANMESRLDSFETLFWSNLIAMASNLLVRTIMTSNLIAF